MTRKFQLGKLFITAGVQDLLDEKEIDNVDVIKLVTKHEMGDWGDLCKQDKEANEDALKNVARLLSHYEVNGHRFYIITEADRSVTTVLLPEEY